MQEFHLQPNNSLSPRGWSLAALAFAIILGLLVFRLAWMGFWVVTVFLIIDFVAVMFAFYCVRKKSNIRESIKIDDKQLKIKHHEPRNMKSWVFDLHWVKVKLQQHELPSQPSRLLVGSHGKWVEFAGFLTNEERKGLWGALNRSINQQLHHV